MLYSSWTPFVSGVVMSIGVFGLSKTIQVSICTVLNVCGILFVEFLIGGARTQPAKDDDKVSENNAKMNMESVDISEFHVYNDDDFDSLIEKLQSFGDYCAVQSGDIPVTCTVPQFPRVSSSLREADQLFGWNESTYFEDTDNCLYSTSIADTSTAKSATGTRGTFSNPLALNSAEIDRNAGNSSTLCHKTADRKSCMDGGCRAVCRCRGTIVSSSRLSSDRVRIGR
jgi:hypothetical protein